MAEPSTTNVRPIKPAEPPAENVWTALHKAQGAFAAIGKTTKGARGKYAPLDEVLEALRPALQSASLTTTALPHVAGDFMLLKRKLVHAPSGTEIELDYPVAPIAKTPQEIGSALTYARRYSLLAICDVHPSDEDDDGEKGGQHSAPRQAAPAIKAPPAVDVYALETRMEKALTLVETLDELDAWKAANRQHWNEISPQGRKNFKAAVEALELKLDGIPV